MNTEILAFCIILVLVTLGTLFNMRHRRVCPHCHDGFILGADLLYNYCPYCKGRGKL